ncbi:MAG TPA: hypothetical protein DCY89_03945 [Gammaproteobacteria bacterium]|nr:hypothetical protein [Gammaproteobacteria bacterium]
MSTWLSRGVLVGALLTLTGCASINQPKGMCALMGALGAGALGGAVSDDNNDIDRVGGAAIGAAVGALAGAVLCEHREPAALPAPAPEPPPAPAARPAPPADSDGDGVIDTLDECPDTTRGTPVDSRGCPELPDLQGVHFGFDQAKLTDEARTILDRGVEALRANTKVRVEIVGHTDSRGSDAHNQGLSERRAAAVAEYLESQGISADRLAVSGMGESKPIATNENEDGRRLNRRVELDAVQMRTY